MQSTEKQISKIIYLLETEPGHTNEQILNSIPKNNEMYPNTRADYRRAILMGRLGAATVGQAIYIIKCLEGEVTHPQQNLVKILKQLNVI